ncbi:uncharacterized protein [Bombus flavifrons]|uniref:uncharacterized protein isoform X1 n=1 Tax=Bombus flavifrons TaxID=103934 RepID=UPI0037043EF8
MKYYRLISLIFILYHIVVYTHNVSCTKIHNLQPFTSIKFNYSSAYHGYKDYDIRSGKQLKEIDLSTNSKALTEQKQRDSRGVSGSNRHLKLGDAHQVANYFLTGGPLKGHAHFVRDCDSNNDDNDTEKTSNPTIKTNTDLLINEQDSNTTSSDSIVGASLPHIPPPHIPPVPHIPPLPITPHLNSILHPALNTITRLPHLLGNNFLQSVLHPDLHPHINTLHDIPSTLVKTVSAPVSELINARLELQDMLHPNGSFLRSINEARENRKARKNLKNNLVFPIGQPPIVGLAQPNSHKNVPLSSMIEPYLPVSHPPPSGYIVHYVPHNTETALQSPTGSSK